MIEFTSNSKIQVGDHKIIVVALALMGVATNTGFAAVVKWVSLKGAMNTIASCLMVEVSTEARYLMVEINT